MSRDISSIDELRQVIRPAVREAGEEEFTRILSEKDRPPVPAPRR